jgi:hypothetical protein
MQKLALQINLFLSLIIVINNDLYSQNRYMNSPFYKNIMTIGGNIGPVHYLGDLSPKPTLRFLRPALNAYVKKTFFPYDFTLKLNYNFSFLTASDKSSRDSIQRIRNLSFSSIIHEFSISMQTSVISFKRKNYTYSLYASFGIGAFAFNPFTYDGTNKVYLRNLGTEGQFSYLPNKQKPYSLRGISFPIGIGIQSNKKSVKTWFLELNYRFTNTGYIDDVFSKYAGFESFQPSGESYNSILASKLQNRSKNIDFGIRGTTRGNEKSDHFFTITYGLDIQLWRYVYKYRTKYNRFKINPKISLDTDVW